MKIKLPNRRWFQFSLRTMLFGVIALSIWLGIEAHIARERRTLLAKIDKAGGSWNTNRLASLCSAEAARMLFASDADENVGDPPLIRRLFGDKSIRQIWLPSNSTPEAISRLSRIFLDKSQTSLMRQLKTAKLSTEFETMN